MMERRRFMSAIASLCAVCLLPVTKHPNPEDNPLKFRQVHRIEGGRWQSIDFSQLRAGDQFRLEDKCDNPVEHGDTTYTAKTDAIPCEGEGNWSVMVA